MRIQGTATTAPHPVEMHEIKREQLPPEAPPKVEQPELDPADIEKLDQYVEQMNETAKVLQSSVRFEMVTKSRMAIRIVNDLTGEVIRQIPSKSLVEALKSMERTMGVLLDEKV